MKFIYLLFFIFFATALNAQQQWQKKQAPLMTEWADKVTSDKPLNEYPRPLMQRNEWLNLNGLWDYAITAANSAKPGNFTGKILVPFPVESALSGVMEPLKEDQVLWYKRKFKLPENWKNKKVILHFGAVDWECHVWVNGHFAGAHRGGYDSFSLNISKALKADTDQEITVKVIDPTNTGWNLRGKQTLHPGGAHYTAVSGIWQTVWLEPVPESAVESLKIETDFSSGTVKLKLAGKTPLGKTNIEVSILDQGKAVARAKGIFGRNLTKDSMENLTWYKSKKIGVLEEISIKMSSPKSWSPENPFLYDLTVTLTNDKGEILDTVNSYFGMRTLKIGKDKLGHTRLIFNGKPMLFPGALDQGYWPDGLYTAPTDEALKFDVEAAKKLGLTAIRKHVKVEPERFYYWCDRLGLLVLQDMPTGGGGDSFTDSVTNPMAASHNEMEMRTIIKQRWNHPSIIMWEMFNEGWGQHDTLATAEWAKILDPGRLIAESSGFPRHGGGDVLDVHGGIPPKDEERISIDSETLGNGLQVKGHMWPGKLWATGTYDPKTGKETHKAKELYNLDEPSKKWFTDICAQFYSHFWESTDRTGNSGDFKVQLYDVETESNGFMTYDRKVWKVYPEVIARAALGKMLSDSINFKNPLPLKYKSKGKEHSELRDPCIIRDGDTYYCVFTMHPFRPRDEKFFHEPDMGSSPGIRMYSSKNMKDWKEENWIVKSSDLPENSPYKHQFWAPEIRKLNGRFYLTFTASNWNAGKYGLQEGYYAFIGVADKVTGPYKYITKIPDGPCDSSLFSDENGEFYLAMPRGDISVQKLDLSQLEKGVIKRVGPEKKVVLKSSEDIGRQSTPAYLEGPWVEKINGKYFMFYAALYKDKNYPEDFGYQTGVAYSDHPLGPYTKDPRGKVFQGGHLTVFEGPDNSKWFSYRWEKDNRIRGRLCIDPFIIDKNGRVYCQEPSFKIK